MRIKLIAIGQKMPAWVNTGFQDYQKRFAKPWQLELIEVNTHKRGTNTDIDKLKTWETLQLIKAVPQGDQLITLDKAGAFWETTKLSQKLQEFSDIEIGRAHV